MRAPSVLLCALVGCVADGGGPRGGGGGRDPDRDTGGTEDVVDADGDGVGAQEAGGRDCDDEDPAIHPGAAEIPYDGVDQDCDGEDLVDADQDGVVAAEVGGADCDDRDPLTWPGAEDAVGDGVDQSCDGIDGTDADLDGYAAVEGGGDDCDDGDPTRHPGAVETWYDGIDQDCDGACDGDQDGDGSVVEGWTVADGDACDTDPEADASAPTDCDDTDPLAEAVLLSTEPEGGSEDVHPWRDVSATLSAVDPLASLVVLDAGGAQVEGVAAWSGTTLAFTPDAPLDTLASYTGSLTWACGTALWYFTTNDGTSQDFLHEWTPGPPDELLIEVINPVATLYGFGMAETGAGAYGWYGEDCAGAWSTGSCHQMATETLLLESVQPYVGSVVPGVTTLFDASFDEDITYYVEARNGASVGSCWTWGHDPSYFAGCDPI